MEKMTIPEPLRALFDEPALAHVSYLNSKGQIVTFPMWVDCDGEHLVVSSPVGSRKGKAFRERPQVSLSIVSTSNPWLWLSASGRVVDIRPDHDLEWIDRMALKYTGQPYQRRTAREIFTVEIDRISPNQRELGRWRGSSQSSPSPAD